MRAAEYERSRHYLGGTIELERRRGALRAREFPVFRELGAFDHVGRNGGAKNGRAERRDKQRQDGERSEGSGAPGSPLRVSADQSQRPGVAGAGIRQGSGRREPESSREGMYRMRRQVAESGLAFRADEPREGDRKSVG